MGHQGVKEVCILHLVHCARCNIDCGQLKEEENGNELALFVQGSEEVTNQILLHCKFV